MAAPGDFIRNILDQARARAQGVRARVRSRVQGVTGRALPTLGNSSILGGGSSHGAAGVLEAAIPGQPLQGLMDQVKDVRQRIRSRVQQVTGGRGLGGGPLLQRVVAPTQPGAQEPEVGTSKLVEVV